MFNFLFGKPKIQSDEEIENYTKRFASSCQIGFDAGEWVMPKKNNPMEVIIKLQALDTSVISEGEGNKTLYRPEVFEEYIGQAQAKARLIARIAGAKHLNENLGHVFISGSAGQGKTTLAYITAKQLGLPFVQMVGGSLKSEQEVVDKIAECSGGILFLDEVHKLKNRLGNFMLPIIEDFQINGKKIKPFTLIAATTEKGELFKHLAPFIQRFPIQIELEDYNLSELFIILKQFNVKKYPLNLIDDYTLKIIARNCRLTPRIGLSLVKDYICVNDINKVFQSNQIIKNGYTKKDIKVLQYLDSKVSGASKATIAFYLGTSLANYNNEIEPWLIKNDLLEINSRRKITLKGKELLKELN